MAHGSFDMSTRNVVREESDDLTRINGICGPIATVLMARGVKTYKQIADWKRKDVERFSLFLFGEKLDNGIDEEDWIGQAKQLQKEKRSTS